MAIAQGKLDRAIEAALERVQLMESMEDEMLFGLPDALMVYCLIAAHLGRRGDMERLFKEKAAKMAAQFGEPFANGYEKWVQMISRIE